MPYLIIPLSSSISGTASKSECLAYPLYQLEGLARQCQVVFTPRVWRTVPSAYLVNYKGSAYGDLPV